MNLQNIISVCIAIVGGSFGLYQWLAKRRIEKSQSRFELLNQFFSSVHETFQAIDYGAKLIGDGLAGSQLERDLDKLLLFFDHIERCHINGVLDPDGYDSFEYFFNRIKDHSDIMSYLKFHKEIICETTSTKISPFSALLKKFSSEIENAKAVNIFEDDRTE